MSSSTATAESASGSLLERAQSFVSTHKQAILVGAAVVVAAGGVAYYAASSSASSSSPPSSEAGDLESGKKKKKKSGRKKKSGKGSDEGPLIDDLSNKTVDERKVL